MTLSENDAAALKARNQRIKALLALGLTQKAVAERLNLHPSTINAVAMAAKEKARD